MKPTRPFARRPLALFAILALVLAACTAETSDTTEVAATPVTTATQDTVGDGSDGEDRDVVEGPPFRVGFISNITTANWWAALDSLSTSYNQAYLGNSKTSLFRLSNPGFVYVPSAAATDGPVAAVQEGNVWVVEQPVRTDLLWTDGTSVTAGDLAFYFDVVREFNLRGDHALHFPPSVISVTAPSDDVVRVEFAAEPGLAAWQNGVGFAPFVSAAFWAPHVEEARAAASEIAASITAAEATQALVDASLADEDPSTDITPEDVTQEQIDAYIDDVVANEGLTVLYAVEAPLEPSAGPQVFSQWEPGAFAVTKSNPDYFDTGTENTFYADGSFRMANADRGEDRVFGGDGAGDVVAQYVEGPFVSEIIWVEHTTKDNAYQKLFAGEIDYVYDPTGVTSALRNGLADNPDLEFTVNQADGFRYLAFNMRKAPMSDVVFRRAVGTIINKELVADTVLGGAVFPGYTIIHPDLTTFYNANVPRIGWDAQGPLSEADRFVDAVQMLKDAGYTWTAEPVIDVTNPDPVTVPGEGLTMPNGDEVPEITILAPGPGYDPYRATYSIWIEQWLNDLGIAAVAEQTDFTAIVASVFPPQTEESAQSWDMYILGWDGADVSLPGTQQVAFFHSREDSVSGGGFNTSGYNSERFDAVADAFEAATDVATAAELTKEMEQILAEDLPYVVLFRTQIVEAFSGRVQFPADVIMGGHSGFPNAWPSAVRVGE